MKPAVLENLVARFDRLNLRERGLIGFSLLAGVVMLWDAMLMQPLSARETGYTAELKTLQQSIAAAATAAEATGNLDPTGVALERQKAVQTSLDAVNNDLASASNGLVPPERMVEVVHDVLSHQRGLSLVSLHNEPVASLIAGDENGGIEFGPYIHPVELIVEGPYLDLLEYLRALEQLPWRLRWKVLELKTVGYPVNRVRIEMSTLSMDKQWLGV